MLADRSFARREHDMLRRVEVGLLDDGARVIRAVPAAGAPAVADSLIPVLPYTDEGPRFAARARRRRLVRALEEACALLGGGSDGVHLDVIHAWGDRCWDLAIGLAAETGANLAIELWSASCTRRMRRAERRAAAVGNDAGPPKGVWLAPNGAVQLAGEDVAGSWPVRAARWGVHPLPRPRTARGIGTVAVSIVASGRDPSSLMPVLDACAARAAEGDDAMFFLDDAGVRDHPAVWKHAEQLGLLDRLSVIPDMESRRDLVLQTDVLVIPEARGEVRSIVLDAMAAGLAVVAPMDPMVEATALPGLAVLVEKPTRGGWSHALGSVLPDRSRLADVGATARALIAEHRPVHRHIEAILDAYRSLAEAPLPFSDAGRSA